MQDPRSGVGRMAGAIGPRGPSPLPGAGGRGPEGDVGSELAHARPDVVFIVLGRERDGALLGGQEPERAREQLGAAGRGQILVGASRGGPEPEHAHGHLRTAGQGRERESALAGGLEPEHAREHLGAAGQG